MEAHRYLKGLMQRKINWRNEILSLILASGVRGFTKLGRIGNEGKRLNDLAAIQLDPHIIWNVAQSNSRYPTLVQHPYAYIVDLLGIQVILPAWLGLGRPDEVQDIP